MCEFGLRGILYAFCNAERGEVSDNLIHEYGKTFPENFPEGYMLYTPASSKSDIYAESLVAYSYMRYDELKKWENTYIEKRGNEYLDFKEKKAELLINLIEKKIDYFIYCFF